MFALVKTRIPQYEASLKGTFNRIINSFSSARDIRFEISKMYGVRAIECTIDIYLKESPQRSRAKIDKVFSLLDESRIRSVVLSEGFPYPELIGSHRLTIPRIKTLWIKSAGKIASSLLAQSRGALSVAIYANRVSSDLDETVRYLLPIVRRLNICIIGNSELYLHGLLKEFGVSVITSSSASASADVHLMLQRPSSMPAIDSKAIAVQFYDDEYDLPCRTVMNIEYSWPHRIKRAEDYPADILLAALNESGALRPEDIIIKNIALTQSKQ